MANQRQLEILKGGVEAWNKWRRENPEAKINLEGANLQGADLRLVNLKRANLKKACLRDADLRGARLVQADLKGADLMQADLRGADLRGAKMDEADIGGADLRGADLIDYDLGHALLLSAFRWRQAKIDSYWFVGGKDIRLPSDRPIDDRLNQLKPISRGAGHAAIRKDDMPIKFERAVRRSKRGSSAKLEDETLAYLQRKHRYLDHVYFAATSLPSVLAGSRFRLDFWMYLEELREDALRRAKEELGTKKIRVSSEGPAEVEPDTRLTVEVKIDGMKVNPSRKDVLWTGAISKAGFIVSVPRNARSGFHTGMATVYIQRLQIAQVGFIIEVGDAAARVVPLPIDVQVVRKAFASYASKDRARVLTVVQGMKKILPELDVFVDVMSLRSGDDWEKKLWAVIRKCDIFYLFWSVHARASVWVEKEWRYALKTIGLKRIEPVPLVSPKEAPPPPELASKHFNDPELAYLQAEKELE